MTNKKKTKKPKRPKQPDRKPLNELMRHKHRRILERLAREFSADDDAT